MNTKDIIKLFPKTCFITQEIIDSGKPIGDELLKTFIPEEIWEDIFWGSSIGTIKSVKIKTEQTVLYNDKQIRVPLYLDRWNVTKPMEITFEIR